MIPITIILFLILFHLPTINHEPSIYITRYYDHVNINL